MYRYVGGPFSRALSSALIAALLALTCLALIGPRSAVCQENGAGKQEGKKGEDGKAKKDSPKKNAGSPIDEKTQEAIKKLFHCMFVNFLDDGRVQLFYPFSIHKDDLLEDFSPPIETTHKHVRWSMASDNGSGLIISEDGILLHKALWKSVTMKVQGLSRSATEKGDTIAAVLAYDHGRRFLGSNLGRQILELHGSRMAAKPIPRAAPRVIFNENITFGFKFEKGVFACKRDDQVTVDTSKNPALTKKVESGQAGLLWLGRGRVRIFVTQIILEGVLDPKWLAEQIAKQR